MRSGLDQLGIVERLKPASPLRQELASRVVRERRNSVRHPELAENGGDAGEQCGTEREPQRDCRCATRRGISRCRPAVDANKFRKAPLRGELGELDRANRTRLRASLGAVGSGLVSQSRRENSGAPNFEGIPARYVFRQVRINRGRIEENGSVPCCVRDTHGVLGVDSSYRDDAQYEAHA
jgi:hypothetical protein